MSNDQVEKSLEPMKLLHSNWLKNEKKIFVPPIPRYLFGGCCNDLGHAGNTRSPDHAEKFICEHFRIRNCLKTNLKRVPNTRVLDVVGGISGSQNSGDQLAALKKVSAKDNVHLTDQGYAAIAASIVKEASLFDLPKQKQPSSRIGKQTDWHGFISHSGIGKSGIGKSESGNRQQGSHRSHPYRSRGRGGGRGRF